MVIKSEVMGHDDHVFDALQFVVGTLCVFLVVFEERLLVLFDDRLDMSLAGE